MSEANEPTPIGTNAPKRGPGRPKKIVAVTSDPLDRTSEVEQLRAEIAWLKSVAQQQATLTVIPVASEELRPGSYVQVGIDATNAPILGKVRWNRSWIERTYPMVTFTPARSMRVAPHGVAYDLGGDIEVTVPQIVKDIYDEVRRGEAEHNIRYRTLSATEDSELAAKANEMPGTKQWSRLYRAGYGLQVSVADAPVETPAA